MDAIDCCDTKNSNLFAQCKKLNSHLNLNSICSSSFKNYGVYHKEIDLTPYRDWLYKDYNLASDDDEVYIPSAPWVEELEFSSIVKQNLYGCVDCHIGIYVGKQRKLNALEFHKCNEILFITAPAILLLGKVGDIENLTYDTSKIEAFFVPENSTIELFSSTLHWAPLAATSKEIRQIVVQQRFTNTKFSESCKKPPQCTPLDKLLFERNKWVLAHKEAENLVKLGAYVGLVGDNLSINAVSDDLCSM